MNKIKKGDIVGRISYGKDIIFVVDKIMHSPNHTPTAILKGLLIRIKADSPISDLEIIDKHTIKSNEMLLESRLSTHFNFDSNRFKKCSNYGKVLHLDGDTRYSQKSIKYYRNFGINAVVKNISESKQPVVVSNLLEKYKPNILVVTGHDRNDKTWYRF